MYDFWDILFTIEISASNMIINQHIKSLISRFSVPRVAYYSTAVLLIGLIFHFIGINFLQFVV